MRKIVSFILALLLTGALFLFCVSLTGRRIIAPAMREDGWQASDTVVRDEMDLIARRIEQIADLYEFDPAPVTALADEAAVRELNSQASRWWSVLLNEGAAGEDIAWKADTLEETIGAHLKADVREADRADHIRDAAADVRRSVENVVLPFRRAVIRLGMQEAGKRIDVVNMLRFFLGVPWAALALCALLSGLIVLAAGREIRQGLPWIGSALGASALVMAALIAMILVLDIRPMIREASESLTLQYSNLLSGALILFAVLAAVLLAGCAACLIMSRRSGKKQDA